jgi:hypothetical protein
MKKYLVRIATAAFALAALAAGAKALASDQLIVNIPYEFVAAGKTLPAGTYRVNRLDDASGSQLVLSSYENRVGVVVVSTEREDARGDKPSFTFQEIGGQHFLSRIETAEHIFTIPVSKSAVLEAAIKSPQRSTSSAASGAN